VAYIEPHGSENAIKHKRRRRTPGVTSKSIFTIVGQFSPNIQKDCAFCDTSTKFGTHVH